MTSQDAPEPLRRSVEHWTEADWDRWEEEMYRQGGERLRVALQEMKARGILDENGGRISKTLPVAMRRVGNGPDEIV